MAVPSKLRSGLNNSWTQSSPEYYDGFTLSYRFFNDSSAFSVSGGVISQSGSEYTVTIPYASATWQHGTYRWEAYVTKDDDKYLIDSGVVEILPNIQSSESFDGRSHNEKVLDALRAVIERRATTDQLSVSIGGKSIQRMPFDQLIKYAKQYEEYVRQERLSERLQGTGQYSGIKKIGVRFDGL